MQASLSRTLGSGSGHDSGKPSSAQHVQELADTGDRGGAVFPKRHDLLGDSIPATTELQCSKQGLISKGVGAGAQSVPSAPSSAN